MNKYKTVKKNYYFKRILKKGKNTQTAILKVSYFKNNLGSNRIGIAVNSNVRSSVKRNHLKRKIREAFRLLDKDTKKGFDIIILLKDIEADFNKIKYELSKCYKKLGLYEEHRS